MVGAFRTAPPRGPRVHQRRPVPSRMGRLRGPSTASPARGAQGPRQPRRNAGARASSAVSATRASSRASAAPRQRCAPCPKATCAAGGRERVLVAQRCAVDRRVRECGREVVARGRPPRGQERVDVRAHLVARPALGNDGAGRARPAEEGVAEPQDRVAPPRHSTRRWARTSRSPPRAPPARPAATPAAPSRSGIAASTTTCGASSPRRGR
jgi:hypothetical protein